MKTKKYFVSYCYSKDNERGFGRAYVDTVKKISGNDVIDEIEAKLGKETGQNITILFWKEFEK